MGFEWGVDGALGAHLKKDLLCRGDAAIIKDATELAAAKAFLAALRADGAEQYMRELRTDTDKETLIGLVRFFAEDFMQIITDDDMELYIASEIFDCLRQCVEKHFEIRESIDATLMHAAVNYCLGITLLQFDNTRALEGLSMSVQLYGIAYRQMQTPQSYWNLVAAHMGLLQLYRDYEDVFHATSIQEKAYDLADEACGIFAPCKTSIFSWCHGVQGTLLAELYQAAGRNGIGLLVIQKSVQLLQAHCSAFDGASRNDLARALACQKQLLAAHE